MNRIAEAYLQGALTDQAIEVFLGSLPVITTITDAAQRDNHSADVARILVDVGALPRQGSSPKAQRTYNTAPGDSPKNILSKMASSLASDNYFALALRVCESLEGLSNQIKTLGDIGAKYTKSGQKLDSAARKILHDIISANQ